MARTYIFQREAFGNVSDENYLSERANHTVAPGVRRVKYRGTPRPSVRTIPSEVGPRRSPAREANEQAVSVPACNTRDIIMMQERSLKNRCSWAVCVCVCVCNFLRGPQRKEEKTLSLMRSETVGIYIK